MKNVLIAALATIAFLFSCSDSPAGLVGEFKSYSPIAEVEEQLRHEGHEWLEVERNEASPSSSAEPFSFVRLKVDAYRIGDATGELELGFFNSRLMRVTLCPESSQDLDRLQSALELGRRRQLERTISRSGGVRTIGEDPSCHGKTNGS